MDGDLARRTGFETPQEAEALKKLPNSNEQETPDITSEGFYFFCTVFFCTV